MYCTYMYIHTYVYLYTTMYTVCTYIICIYCMIFIYCMSVVFIYCISVGTLLQNWVARRGTCTWPPLPPPPSSPSLLPSPPLPSHSLPFSSSPSLPLPISRDVLFTHFESPEEGTRNVVAECVGKLTLVDPNTLLSKLQVREGGREGEQEGRGKDGRMEKWRKKLNPFGVSIPTCTCMYSTVHV